MNRFISAASIVVLAAVAVPSVAQAKTITEVEHYTVGKKTKVVDRTTLHTKTGVVDVHVKITKADGKFKTISAKATPASTGGYTVSKTVTGFNGVSHMSTGHAAGGHGGKH